MAKKKARKRKTTYRFKVDGYTIIIRKNSGERLSPWTLMIESSGGMVVYDDESGWDTMTAAKDYALYRLKGRTTGGY